MGRCRASSISTLSAAAVGTVIEDEAQRIFTQQSEQSGTADTPRQRRGQALAHLMIKTILANGQLLCDPHNKWKRDFPQSEAA